MKFLSDVAVAAIFLAINALWKYIFRKGTYYRRYASHCSE